MKITNDYTQYAIYYNPSDFPGEYVVRPWLITVPYPTPLQEIYVGDSLNDARSFIPAGMHRILKQPQDDISIVETWI